jgi:hypothetical protein
MNVSIISRSVIIHVLSQPLIMQSRGTKQNIEIKRKLGLSFRSEYDTAAASINNIVKNSRGRYKLAHPESSGTDRLEPMLIDVTSVFNVRPNQGDNEFNGGNRTRLH